ncbi:CopG family transcriptional regulator [Nonlabens spongiae]|uniref:CopG family transcriptional regulator n=1 Tax=Nonlabens spongiae TaxID=331648 RepID=A0A1W6MKY6_9FLAO|nr:CopG family transcriptional regulator [Nonlabens spongiae]ARN78260.1 CopG family transcriptional regulator [Nonlabens spongiae]
MTRQSISLTEPNDTWMKELLNSKEYSSKSEIVNDLIRQARKQQAEIEFIRKKIEAAEKSDFTDMTREEILEEARRRST